MSDGLGEQVMVIVAVAAIAPVQYLLTTTQTSLRRCSGIEPAKMAGLERKLAATTPELSGRVYWQRDPVRSPNCWTKVFSVLEHAFLWFFQREDSAPRSQLVQLAVADVISADGGRLLHVIDPSGEELCISCCDDNSFDRWRSKLKEAADLTAAFFRTSGLGVRDLPRWSTYRGTLEDYNRVSKRTRCKDAVAQLVRRWRIHQLWKDVEGQHIPEIEAVKNVI